MGRSVSTPSAARVVSYHYLDLEEQDDAQWIFDNMVDGFRETLKSMFPSVETADSWIGREDHVVAENKLALFGISEYCGLVAYWIVPKDDARGWAAYRWIDSIADRFTAAFGTLQKTGTASNGESFYERIG